MLVLYKPPHTTTFGCHGNLFGYVLDNLFTNTMVSSYFLRNVPIPILFTFMYQYAPNCVYLLYRLKALYLCSTERATPFQASASFSSFKWLLSIKRPPGGPNPHPLHIYKYLHMDQNQVVQLFASLPARQLCKQKYSSGSKNLNVDLLRQMRACSCIGPLNEANNNIIIGCGVVVWTCGLEWSKGMYSPTQVCES